MAISCEPSDVVSAASCFCMSEDMLDRVTIYLLCTWANGGEIPQLGFVFGDPEANWSFGDPITGEQFGAPF